MASPNSFLDSAMRVNSSIAADAVRTVGHWSLGRRGWCDSELPAEVIAAVCGGDIDRLLFAASPLQVKDRCVVARYETETHSLLVKRHIWGGLSRTIRMAFRESAARQCARIGSYLHSLGVRTPRPRGTVDFRIGPWVHRSYLLSDYVEGVSLYHHIRYGTQSAAELQHLARQVAALWQQLVTLGVSHNDFKPENFIVDDQSQVWLIDFEKTRLAGRPERQRSRLIADALNFLHIRGWHCRQEARAIFAAAFLNVPNGEWLKAVGVERAAQGLPLDDSECDPGLSVIILCPDQTDFPLLQCAIRSVRDIADEILLVQPNEQGQFHLLERLDTMPNQPLETDRHASSLNSSTARLVRFAWVLVLQQNEYVTPFLAKELHQRICSRSDSVAFRVTHHLEYFGRTIPAPKCHPVRLFLSAKCSLGMQRGEPRVATNGQAVGQLIGTIHANESVSVEDFITWLNERSSQNAFSRLQAGERPRLYRSGVRAIFQFLKDIAGPNGFRSGWTGVQLALLRSAFGWLEEAKLWQLTAEFDAGKLNSAVRGFEPATVDQHSHSADSVSRAA